VRTMTSSGRVCTVRSAFKPQNLQRAWSNIGPSRPISTLGSGILLAECAERSRGVRSRPCRTYRCKLRAPPTIIAAFILRADGAFIQIGAGGSKARQRGTLNWSVLRQPTTPSVKARRTPAP